MFKYILSWTSLFPFHMVSGSSCDCSLHFIPWSWAWEKDLHGGVLINQSPLTLVYHRNVLTTEHFSYSTNKKLPSRPQLYGLYGCMIIVCASVQCKPLPLRHLILRFKKKNKWGEGFPPKIQTRLQKFLWIDKIMKHQIMRSLGIISKCVLEDCWAQLS